MSQRAHSPSVSRSASISANSPGGGRDLLEAADLWAEAW